MPFANMSTVYLDKEHNSQWFMPFSTSPTSLYLDSAEHNSHSQWLCHIKREVEEELDYNNSASNASSVNGVHSLHAQSVPMFANHRIKQEPISHGYGNCSAANNTVPECCNSLITSSSTSNNASNATSNTSSATSTSNGGVFALAQIQNLALKECAKEIDVACDALGISADPFNWSITDVRSWLLWTQRQFNLQPFPLEYFSMDGMTLCSLTESDFKQRAPHCGEILYAQLDIWKTAVEFRPEDIILEFSTILNNCWSSPLASEPPSSPSECGSSSVHSRNGSINGDITSASCLSPLSPPMCSSPASTINSATLNSPKPGHPNSIDSVIVTSDYSSEGAQSDDDISDDACDLPSNSTVEAVISTPTSTGGRSGSGSHIHLWQFLKELLSQPQLYGSCIRWLDRSKGIFKIEDSVRVARLWGKRKNRPAMNYDKLSRSIRQYYKKGIMKKTERSQRLVYQFCHPYCL